MPNLIGKLFVMLYLTAFTDLTFYTETIYIIHVESQELLCGIWCSPDENVYNLDIILHCLYRLGIWVTLPFSARVRV